MAFEAQAKQFAREGWTVFSGALAGEPLQVLREACAGFVAREDARMDAAGVDSMGITHRGKRYFANECQREAPQLRPILFGETMAQVCAATLGEDAYFFFDQFVVKGPEKGLAFGWHQDSGYMVGNGGPTDHRPYLTCWIPLDDATAANGTVRLIPFSEAPASREAILPHDRQPATNDLVAEADPTKAVTVEASAGDVVVFSSRLLHATGANETDRPRRVFLAQYTAEAVLNPGTRQLRRNAVPVLRNGKRATLS